MTTETKVHRYGDKTPGAREEFLKAMHSGEQFECDAEMYYDFLEVLPPVFMGKNIEFPDGQKVRARFGFAEGEEFITAFWMTGKERIIERPEGGVICSLHLEGEPGARYFGRRTNLMNGGH